MLGLVVGVALGVAGALMQALTRNPLADPGLLGVNAGAAAAVVDRDRGARRVSPHGYVWFAFAGAAVASVVVYALGAAGRGGATPVRLALAGTRDQRRARAPRPGVTLLDRAAFDRFRFWDVGALAGRDAVAAAVAPFLVVGPCSRSRSAGRSTRSRSARTPARALGRAAGRTRVLGAVAITLLCGAATAAAGPIVFIGLTVPHVARAITGPDQRWVLPYSLLLGAGAAARRRRDRPRRRPAGRAPGRHRHRVDRRAGVHRARPPPPDRAAVTRRVARASAVGALVARRRRAVRAARRSSVGAGEIPVPPGRRASPR